MNAFFGGIVFGVILAGSVFVIFITRTKRTTRCEPIEWEPEFHEPQAQPPVTTRILIRERNIQL